MCPKSNIVIRRAYGKNKYAFFYNRFSKRNLLSLSAKYEFKKNSLIYLNDYIIDKNERKIKKKGPGTSTVRKRN